MAEKAAVLWGEHSEKLFIVCFPNTGSECKCNGQEGGFKPNFMDNVSRTLTKVEMVNISL